MINLDSNIIQGPLCLTLPCTARVASQWVSLCVSVSLFSQISIFKKSGHESLIFFHPFTDLNLQGLHLSITFPNMLYFHQKALQPLQCVQLHPTISMHHFYRTHNAAQSSRGWWTQSLPPGKQQVLEGSGDGQRRGDYFWKFIRNKSQQQQQKNMNTMFMGTL